MASNENIKVYNNLKLCYLPSRKVDDMGLLEKAVEDFLSMHDLNLTSVYKQLNIDYYPTNDGLPTLKIYPKEGRIFGLTPKEPAPGEAGKDIRFSGLDGGDLCFSSPKMNYRVSTR